MRMQVKLVKVGDLASLVSLDSCMVMMSILCERARASNSVDLLRMPLMFICIILSDFVFLVSVVCRLLCVGGCGLIRAVGGRGAGEVGRLSLRAGG